ncbi:MAG: thioesterase family protein [Alphaproteobacteria bacterium]|jgi:acyl-CoA thioester hydrolase|nr:thioesterase-like protein [Rhodospirillaceae bacterium]MDG2482931.1 thioesterase family protein [Alphaproteobacteria bacterium]MBT6203141.1 thioesterase-like protein [Rhodospirillaceae bacterium]MBT6511466.1 thioesterase-like protein [Rhodospirillaceae bacterium]MBT7614870.1 thioesterase-like protein [Rhodospirillaceae bacterium]
MEVDPRLFQLEMVVKPEWIDEYGHLNMAYYVLICDHATSGFWDAMNAPLTQDKRDGGEYAVVETHVNYLDEVRAGDSVLVTTQVLAADSKRYRLFHRMYHAGKGYLAATNEVMSLGFNLNTRGMMEFVPAVYDRLQQTVAEHADIERDNNVGRAIGQPRKR